MVRRLMRRPANYGVVAAMLLTFAAASGVAAQTLTEPNPKTKWSPPAQGGSKPEQTKQVKSCPEYGPGFVKLPGTDACIKVGGSVTVEGGGGR